MDEGMNEMSGHKEDVWADRERRREKNEFSCSLPKTGAQFVLNSPPPH